MGKKKLKNSTVKVNIWICCNCGAKDVDIVEYTENGPPKSTSRLLDFVDPDVVE
jgi:hypothetical protein